MRRSGPACCRPFCFVGSMRPFRSRTSSPARRAAGRRIPRTADGSTGSSAAARRSSRACSRHALGPDHRRAQLADRRHAAQPVDHGAQRDARVGQVVDQQHAAGQFALAACVMYLAMSSRPWIVPASARYELVDMIASGLSNTRDSTSPGRMPPRARHRIWSNCQPDACDLERQALDQHVVLVPGDVEVFAVVGEHASSAV